MHRSPELRVAYLRWLEDLSTGVFAQPAPFAWADEGASLVGRARDEWFTDEAATVAWTRLSAVGATGLQLVAGDPQAYSEGSIGWVVDQTQLRTANGVTQPTRLTAIFRRAASGWQLVHVHHSRGVRNEESAQ